MEINRFKFLKETLKYVSGATLLAVGVLLFVNPVLAQEPAPSTEVSSACYTLGTSTITFDGSTWLACLGDKIDPLPPNVYFANYSGPEGDFLADSTGGKEDGEETLLCDAPSQCVHGFGTTPSDGTVRQFRYSSGYLSGTFATLTLVYQGGEFIPFYDLGEITPPEILPPQVLNNTYQTRFTDQTLSIASSSLQVEVDYFIDTEDFLGVNDRPDIILISISNSDTTQFEQNQVFTLPLENGSSSRTLNFDTPIPDGDYTAEINFFNLFSQDYVLNRSFRTVNFTVSGGAVTEQTVVDFSDALSPPDGLSPSPCGITSIGGCIENAAVSLFYPSTDSIDLMTSQYQILQTKVPFVYVYQASDLITGMYTGTAAVVPELTVSTGMGDITFISQDMIVNSPLGSFVPVVRDLIALGLWLMLFTALYKKTLKVHDNVTT